MDRLIRIERPVADDSLDGAGSGEWRPVAVRVWCSIQDMLPSRGEKAANGFESNVRPSRLRMRYRDNLTSAMRFVDVTGGSDGRVMQIISGPAMMGRRDGIEFMVEDYSPAGNNA